MNRNELVHQVAERAGLDGRQATAAVAAVFAVIQETLAGGGTVAITGFGAFKTRRTGAKSRFNHLAGRVIDTPEKTVAVFKAGTGLSAAVDQQAKAA